MTKTEFLEALEAKLSGEVSENVIRQNLRYYSDYIDSAIRNGKTENEILEELGSPVLIARTIIDTKSETAYGSYAGRNYEEMPENTGNDREGHAFHLDLDAKKAKWLFIGIVVLIVLLLFTVLRLLMPILLPVLLIIIVYKLFKKE